MNGLQEAGTLELSRVGVSLVKKREACLESVPRAPGARGTQVSPSENCLWLRCPQGEARPGRPPAKGPGC